MPRFLSYLLIGLTLTVGLTAGAVVWRTISNNPTVSDLSAADPSIGYAFYDALDTVLNTGDRSALDAVVRGDFINHAQANQSADELVDELTAFAASFPGTRIEVVDIQTASGTLVATLGPIQPNGSVAGMPFSTKAMTGNYEVLRVKNGKVSERWASGLPAVDLHTFDDAALSTGSFAASAIRLERIVLPEAGWYILPKSPQTVVIVETGTLRMIRRWMTGSGEVKSDVVPIEAGQPIQALPGATITLEHDGEGPAQLLLFSFRRVSPVEAVTPPMTEGVTSELLWESNLPPSGTEGWHVSLGTMHLPAGTEGTLHAAGRRLLIVCGDDGAARLVAPGGQLSALDTNFWPSDLGHAATIDAGNALSAEVGSIEVRSEADVTLWLIAITPDALPGTPESAAAKA